MDNNTSITIAGAGPGGLICARILQQHGFNVTVYDSDASVAARNQGGTLDMHADMGQIALREAGLIDKFFALSRPEGQSMRILNRHGDVVREHAATEGDDAAPEIDRGQLRSLLENSLAPGTVRWNHKIAAATAHGDGTHRLTFDNGASIDADFVIGADGAWSKIRPLMSDAIPFYTGITFVEAHFDDVDSSHPAVAELVGNGHVFATGDNKSLIGQRNSNHHVRVYIGMRTDLDWHQAAGIDLSDTKAVRGALLNLFDGWDTRLLPLITDNDGLYINRPLFVLPTPHTWSHTAGATLLGDAAHLMSPFGGWGANLAMLDASELALSIASESTSDAAIMRYEQVMLPRSVEKAITANEILDGFFAPGDFDPANIPDFDEEGARHKEAASAYEAGRNS